MRWFRNLLGKAVDRHSDENDAPIAFFRGTSEGFSGSPTLQRIGVTPATTDPVVATIFATEAENYGRGVVHIADRSELAGVEILAGNVLATLEREVGFHILPSEFAIRANLTITASQARSILTRMGVSIPIHIRGPASVDAVLRTTPRLTNDQIQQFLNFAPNFRRSP